MAEQLLCELLCSEPASVEALDLGRDAAGAITSTGLGAVEQEPQICCVGGIFFSIDLERKQNLLPSVFF